MKRYKLLKDLPFAKAGEIFKEMHDDEAIVLAPENWDQHRQSIYIDEIENLDDWFEEVRTFGEYYYVIDVGHAGYLEDGSYRPNDTLGRMEIGNIFKTKEEAEKYLEYLKAKTIIKQDAKGFKPDWNSDWQSKFSGYWNCNKNEAVVTWTISSKSSEIYFSSREDVEESFKKHPDEWKTYLTYEQ
nr:MAG TPA: hypothetical protein [Caudoviricetes sp.]